MVHILPPVYRVNNFSQICYKFVIPIIDTTLPKQLIYVGPPR